MEVVDKIKIASKLTDLKVWQYAKILSLLNQPRETEQQHIVLMCDIMELCSDKPAQMWREQYKMDFTVAMFERVKQVFDTPLPVEAIESFVFSSITPDEERKRRAEILTARIWKRRELKNDLEVDMNRTYHIEKSTIQTFEQVIQTEALLKEIVSLDAQVTIKNFARLPRLLAFVCKLQGEQFHYFDKNDNQYKFNYALIDEREKVFMHLDIETAWKAYLGFFLTERQRLESTRTFGTP